MVRLRAFHRCCDNKGPTLVVVQSNGFIYGGFTLSAWDNPKNGVFKSAEYIFTLTNPRRKPSKFYPIEGRGIYCCEHAGPVFGVFDLYTSLTRESYASFPTTYKDTTGIGNSLFTGSSRFDVTEVEVYEISAPPL